MSKSILIVGSRLALTQLFAASTAIFALAETPPDLRAELAMVEDKMKTGMLPQRSILPVRDLRPTHQGVRAQAPLYHRARNRLG